MDTHRIVLERDTIILAIIACELEVDTWYKVLKDPDTSPGVKAIAAQNYRRFKTPAHDLQLALSQSIIDNEVWPEIPSI